jgi:ubiquinone/menaquinone biosynthesis C-methylase UbiE
MNYKKLFSNIIGSLVILTKTKKTGKYKLNDNTIKKFVIYMKKYPELYTHTAEILKKNIPKKVTEPVIVDLGAGPGYLSKAIAEINPKSQIIAVDPSEKMLEQAKKVVKFEDYKTMVGDSENIPVEDNFADIVVSRFTLTYWEKPNESLIEIMRILKPGGRFVLEALNKNFSKWKLFAIMTHMFFKGAGSIVIRYHSEAFKTAYSLNEIEKFLNNAGLNVIYREAKKKDWKFILVSEKKT